MPRTAEKVREFPRSAARRHPRLHRPYRRHADRGHGRHRRPPERRRLPGHAAFPRAHHQGPRHAGRLDRALPGRGGRRIRRCCWPVALPTRMATFDSSMQLMETGLFDKAGFKRLHVAGHPEGNRDIDPDGRHAGTSTRRCGGSRNSPKRTDAEMAIATQFAFEAEPIIDWADSAQGRRHRPAHPYRHRRARPSCRR